MPWCMRLNEFDFDIRLKKGLPILQADALSHFRSLRETSVLSDEDISTYPLPFGANSNKRDIKDELIVELALTTDIAPSSFPITLEEIRLSKGDDNFSCTMRACLKEGKRLPFALNNKNFLFSSVDGSE